MAQEGIRSENDLGVRELIRDVFIKGSCRNVSNVTPIGNDSISIGQFFNGESTININDGILLTTGSIDLVSGPNQSDEGSVSLGVLSEDPDLELIATDDLYDATGIEFDFVPIGSRVTFRYVFASEEYCEFVNTEFNDVFGFFVSGPGINGTFSNNAINVAKLPETGEDVSINTVNHLENVNSFINNVTNIDAQRCDDIGFNDDFQELIEFDGFTVTLLASFRVIPCETYHMRLIIGDVGDDRLDSAVFLETNSFDLGEGIDIRAEVPGSIDNVSYENCVDGQFVFTRNSFDNLNEDLPVDFIISPQSEAINGVDYEMIPSSITIPAGELTYTLPIKVIDDTIAEGPESIKLELVYDCDCIDPVLTELIIDEATELEVSNSGVSVCANEEFRISPQIDAGIPPFRFLWDTGLQMDTLQASVTEATQFSVTITDLCNSVADAEVNVAIQSTPTATLTGNFDFCETVMTGIPVQLGGNAPWQFTYSINGIEQEVIRNIQTNPFLLDTPSTGTYTISSFSDAFCEGMAMGSAEVVSQFNVRSVVTPPTCFNTNDGSIEITQLDAATPVSIEWNIESDNERFLINLESGVYTLNIIDANGCLFQESFDLSAVSDDLNTCIPVYIPNSFSPNNDGINDVFGIFLEPGQRLIRDISTFQIFDRWGSLVYELNNFIPENGVTGWDGLKNGKPVNADVYMYRAVVSFTDASTLLLHGDVSLIR